MANEFLDEEQVSRFVATVLAGSTEEYVDEQQKHYFQTPPTFSDPLPPSK